MKRKLLYFLYFLPFVFPYNLNAQPGFVFMSADNSNNPVKSLSATLSSCWAVKNYELAKINLTNSVVDLKKVESLLPGSYSLDGNSILAITDSNVHINYTDGTGHWGILNYDGTQWQNTSMTGLPNSSLSNLTEDNSGGAWIAFGNTLYKFYASVWTAYPDVQLASSINFYHLACGKNDTLWALTSDNYLVRFYNSIYDTMFHFNGIYPSSIAVDTAGYVWMGSYDGLFRYYHGIMDTFNSSNSAVAQNTSSICSDKTGKVYVYGYPNQLLKWNGSTFVNIPTSFPDYYVTTLSCDIDNKLWVGLQNGYVNKFEGGVWTQYFAGYECFQDSEVTSLCNYNNYVFPPSVMAGTKNGLSMLGSNYYEWEITSQYDSTNSDLPNQITDLAYSDNSSGFYPKIGTTSGIYFWNSDSSFTHYDSSNSPIPNDTITCLLNNYWDRLLIGTQGGLAIYNSDSTWTVFDQSNSPLPSNHIQCVAGRYGYDYYYVGTDSGMAIYDGSLGTWQILNTNNSGLPDNDITAIYPTNSSIYFGTKSHGVADSSFSNNGWDYYDTSSGLASDSITFIGSGLWWPYYIGGDIYAGSKGGGLLFFDEGGGYNQNLTEDYNGFHFNNAYDELDVPNFESEYKLISTDKGVLWTVYGSSINETSNPETAPIQAWFDNNTLYINQQSSTVEKEIIRLYDLQGQLIKSANVGIKNGMNHFIIPDCYSNTGIYLVNVQSNSILNSVKVFKAH